MTLVSAARAVAAGMLAGSLLTGCAGTERVVLMPGADGGTGSIVIEGKSGDSTLTQAWSEARIGSRGVTQRQRTAADVEAEFAPALAAMPLEAKRFTLYFAGDSDTLTPESQAEAATVLAEIARMPHAEVVAIGHTDRLGELAYNDDLALARARVVRDTLIGLGVDAARISIAGRGEREPMIAAPDETAEPRNRRVEINVR